MSDVNIATLKPPFRASITPPGSKSLTNRALVLAALAEGESALRNVLFADDTVVMLDCLRNLGFEIQVDEAAQRVRVGTLAPDAIDETTIDDALYTVGMPEPDLLIRTAGEMRISNFLLWQISYAELWVTETCWPDFNEATLRQALHDYAKRERRFGGLK